MHSKQITKKEISSKFHEHILINRTKDIFNWVCYICDEKFNSLTEGRFRYENRDFDKCFKCILLEQSGYNFSNVYKCQYDKHLLKDMIFHNSTLSCRIFN